MKKQKFNYAIVMSAFGDFWVGKTKLKADNKNIFADLEGAINKAQDLYCEEHPEFDCNADEGDDAYDDELFSGWDNIRNNAENDELDEISKKIEDRIVRR